MKFDLHVHTIYSKHWFFGIDALNTPTEVVKAAIKKGLDGIAITDHDNVKGSLKAKIAARRIKKDFQVLTGSEISSAAGHVLGLGIKEDVKPGLSLEETLERIKELGGISIAAHPFAKFWFRKCLAERAVKADAIEVLNACTCRNFQNKKAERLAKSAGKPGVASSDSHSVRTVGLAGIICNNDPLSSIKNGKLKIFGAVARKREFIYLSAKKCSRSIKWKFGKRRS